MNFKVDHQMFLVLNGVIGGLVVASLVGFALSRRVKSEDRKATIDNLNARIRAWWIMIGIFSISFVIGPAGSMLLFAFVSAAGAAGIRKPHQHHARRPSHALLVILCIHAAAILVLVSRLVRAGHHSDSGLRLLICSHPPGAGRRIPAVFSIVPPGSNGA